MNMKMKQDSAKIPDGMEQAIGKCFIAKQSIKGSCVNVYTHPKRIRNLQASN